MLDFAGCDDNFTTIPLRALYLDAHLFAFLAATQVVRLGGGSILDVIPLAGIVGDGGLHGPEFNGATNGTVP
jgi:hypothetical protein